MVYYLVYNVSFVPTFWNLNNDDDDDDTIYPACD